MTEFVRIKVEINEETPRDEAGRYTGVVDHFKMLLNIDPKYIPQVSKEIADLLYKYSDEEKVD